MPKTSIKRRFARRVATLLRAGLKSAGFAVDKITFESIRGTRLSRVTLVAKGFEKLSLTERQAVVWRILNRSLSSDEQLLISMIITLAPKHLEPR